MILSLSLTALAVPTELTHTGRVFDSTGLPLSGAHTITVTFYDAETGGTQMWAEDIATDLDDGFFAVELGASSTLDDSLFDGSGDLWVTVAVDGGAETPAQRIRSVPWARRAGVASSVSGGVVDASEIRVGGNVVIDASGALTAGGSLGSLSCTPGQIASYDGSDWVCTSPGGAVSWNDLTDVPLEIADGIDDDTLGALTCTPDQIVRWDGAAWLCSADVDTTLDEGAVDAFVANNGYAMDADISTVGKSNDFGDLDNIPAGLSDGDDDTQLDEAAVDAFVANNGYAMDADIATVGKTGDFADLSNVPAFALDADISVVGKSGLWNDLLNIPGDFADGVDDVLDAATVESYIAAADTYVQNTGDAMSGGLTVTGGITTDELVNGPQSRNWSGYVQARGSSAADDIWHLGEIMPNNYNNAGLIIDICNASRWNNPGCQTTYVSYGRYDVTGEEFNVEQKASSSDHVSVPIRVSYGPGVSGARPLIVWAEVGTSNGLNYHNVHVSVRGIGHQAAFTPGTFGRDQISNVTLENTHNGTQNIPTVQRHTTDAYDSTTNNWVGSREMTFTKTRDDTGVRIRWFDNFRCSGTSVACRWDVYIDGQLCQTPQPIRQDIYNGGSSNNHYGMTVNAVCFDLANGTPFGAGTHTLQVFERGSPSHTHGAPVLGWNWADQGVQAFIEVEEIY